ncbi:nucleotide exchange factor GrpE [Candidatus Saccharibacteria bacterium]|nr:nucleotide exchange factor GrpE [Candidatus Saccharibacteria bacterium]
MKKDIKDTKENEKIAELTADLQRTRADFENFRKQVEIQKENEKKTVKFATVCKLLPLLDDLDRAILSYSELSPLNKSLEKSLGDLGLAKIDSKEGVEFNPDLHEAVMVEGEGEKEVIAETLRPGYYYEKEVIRPAMVKVKRTS